MKRFTAFLTALVLIACLVPLRFTQAAGTVLYRGVISKRYAASTTNIYAKMDKDSNVLRNCKPGTPIDITAVYPNWVEVVVGSGRGYVLRHRIDVLETVDPVNTAPYGVEINRYYTRITQDTPVRAEKSNNSDVLTTLTEGALVSFIGMEDGWCKLIYHRQYGYVDSRALTELLMTSEDAELADGSRPIAVFTSFFSNNEDRIANLNLCCERMNRVMRPGESLDFNNQVGPFKVANGFKLAPGLRDGELIMSPGGGSCQVSSTLYNTVLQLTGITILERHPHGSNGASYLPHGVDASSGDLNFRIRNDYGFSVRIEGSTHDFALFIAIYKEIGS